MLLYAIYSALSFATLENITIDIHDNTIHGNGNVIVGIAESIIIGGGGDQPDRGSPPIASRPPPPPLLPSGYGERDTTSGIKYASFAANPSPSPVNAFTREWTNMLYKESTAANLPVNFIANASVLQALHPLLYATFINPGTASGSGWGQKFPEAGDNRTDAEAGEDSDGDTDLTMLTLAQPDSQGTSSRMTQVAHARKVDVMAVHAQLGDQRSGAESAEPVPGQMISGSVAGTLGSSVLSLLGRGGRKLGIVQDPGDDRVRIGCGTTDNWAWQTIVSIGGYCTGTLISPNTVLTAGHCVFDTSTGAWMEPPWVRIHPCSASDTTHGGDFDWTRIRTFKGWTRSGKDAWDIAVIKLNGNPGFSDGWKSFGYTSAITSSWVFNVAGYPADKAYLTMWNDANRLCKWTDDLTCVGNPGSQTMLHLADTRGGQSGSGFYFYKASATPQRRIYGVHVAWSGLTAWPWSDTATDTTWNRATRIRSSIFSSFCNFIDNPGVC